MSELTPDLKASIDSYSWQELQQMWNRYHAEYDHKQGESGQYWQDCIKTRVKGTRNVTSYQRSRSVQPNMVGRP